MKRKWIIIVICLFVLVGSGIAAFAWWLRQPSELPASVVNQGGCSVYGVEFDATAVQRQFLETDQILQAPEAFWLQDRAHRLVATSPRINQDSLPPEIWLQSMEALSEQSLEHRNEEGPYATAREIKEYGDSYCELGIAGIASMLPANADLSTTVYLVAYTDPSAFTVDSNLVMNTDLENYFGKSAGFLNTLGHELFHIGYWRYQAYQEEVWPDNYALKAAMVTLQNEGMATYSQEISMDLYPMRLEQDLFLSQRKLLVRVFIGRVNNLLEEANTLPEAQVISILYKGLNQRALYAVGAHMARTIDHELGRAALAETVAQGPLYYIQTYNQLVDENWRITEMPEPAILNPAQQLRKAARDNEVDKIPGLLAQIADLPAERLNGAMFEEIRSAGLILAERGQFDLAVQVFKSMVSCFPDHPQSHIHLAGAYLKVGELEQAESCYDQALEIDPSLTVLID